MERSPKKQRILIVDDEKCLVRLMRMNLEHDGFEVVEANNGAQAMDRLRASIPDLILLDVMMPDIDGWEVLQRLRNSPDTAGIPVIICSIFNDPKLAFSLGASAALPKPVRRDQLFEVLKQLEILP